MENTLFGSGSTKLTSTKSTFDLNAGLYEAMYEQSQMELKILEAMIKADSLSRKYRTQGIYSESAIQAFNEEAKSKIGQAISKMVGKIKEKLKGWWSAFRTWAGRIIDKIKAKLNKRKEAKSQAKIDAANRSKMDDIIDKNLNMEVKWPAKNINWVSAAGSMFEFINSECTLDKAKAGVNALKNGEGNPYERDERINNKVEKFANLTSNPSLFTTKTLKEIPEIKNGGLEKIITDKNAQIAKIGTIVDNCNKKLETFEKELSDDSYGDAVYSDYVAHIADVNKGLVKIMQDIQNVAKQELACYVEVSTRINTVQFENATIFVNASLYEAFMDTNSYDLYSAEGIKRFAAAKLEAAMGEISDVIDQAIGSNNAQGIENVNLASTDVLGAGVSNDPNRLVYDDDCYSQGGTFGDENIAGYVDASIAGTSTSVARGNETKAAMESFFFNW